MEDSDLLYAHKVMEKALSYLLKEKKSKPTRENSETITLLETAMMWNNKDRANKGELKASPTHVNTNTY